MHDLIAELTGYRNELAAAQRYGHTDRAKAVQGEIARVAGDIQTRMEDLLSRAEAHDNAAQHTLGAQVRVEATRLRRALEADQPPAAENASEKAPRERAVPKKAS